ncbi:MAG: ABC transporter permease subunit, partial [Candidatus Heimdallarchaeota archaeon]|nr:ABC transporter permease subunit [Candidatus Heimdallarchaeota archaeon]
MQDILNHPLFLIAKKEIMDNVRNRWIIIVTIIFAILTIAMSAFGSFISEGWQDLGITITLMMSIVQLLVPIIGLMLGYAAIIGEIEKGSMSALLSLPVTRLEVVIGKFLGLGGVLAFSITVGFGIAGIVIGIMVPNVDFLEYLVFIGATILVGLV